MHSFGKRLLAGAMLCGAMLTAAAVPSAAATGSANAAGAAAQPAAVSSVCYYQVRGVYDWLNVRSRPTIYSSVIGRFYPNQYVEGNCKQAYGPGASVWVNVKAPSGAWGWSSKDYLALLP
jgi:uncharacterized protein YgiM (DUF1202 family)